MASNKKCFVPNCLSSTIATPDKVFVGVKDCLKESWCQTLKIGYSPKKSYFCCEDHLDLQEDLQNYYKWKLMHARPILKESATLKLYPSIESEVTVKEEHCELVVQINPTDTWTDELMHTSTRPILNNTASLEPFTAVESEVTVKEEDCELVEEFKPTVILDSSDESTANADPLAIATVPTVPPPIKIFGTLKNFKLNLYNEVRVKKPQEKTVDVKKICQPKRKGTFRPRLLTPSSYKSILMDSGNVLPCKSTGGMQPTLQLLKTPHEAIITEPQASGDSLKHATPSMYQLLVVKDLPKPACKPDPRRRPRSVGVQCRPPTRDACVGYNGRKSCTIGFKTPATSLIEGENVEVLYEPCSCCLFRPSDKYLKTFYSDERTEIYADMIQECFGIQVATEDDSGICEVCVRRLRDATDFKLQVRRSQRELRARLDPTYVRHTDRASETLEEDEGIEPPNEPEDPPIVLPEIIVRSDGLYECPVCHKTLKREAGLKSHLLLHFQQVTQETRNTSDSDENNVYECDECGKEFTEKEEYTLHVKTHERELYKPDPSEVTDETQGICNDSSDDSSEKSSEDSENKVYECHLCDREFFQKRVYVRHLKKHETPFKCDFCPKEFYNETYFKQHRSIHTGEVYICDLCKKKFYDKKQLSVHVALHMNIKLFSCEVCGRRFKLETSLKIHELYHIKEKNYSCGICMKKFGHELLLSRHEITHKKEYVCEHCGKQFPHEYSLVAHRRIHTGDKPFQCQICSKRFCNNSDLKIHYRRHSGVKPYSCDICPKKFSTGSYLKVHKQMHRGEKNYACDICDKKFLVFTNLRLHKLVHTGEKPHCCEKCGKSFRRREHLTKHLDTHKERKYYSCQFCPKVYSNKEGFAQHSRNHAKGLI